MMRPARDHKQSTTGCAVIFSTAQSLGQLATSLAFAALSLGGCEDPTGAQVPPLTSADLGSASIDQGTDLSSSLDLGAGRVDEGSATDLMISVDALSEDRGQADGATPPDQTSPTGDLDATESPYRWLELRVIPSRPFYRLSSRARASLEAFDRTGESTEPPNLARVSWESDPPERVSVNEMGEVLFHSEGFARLIGCWQSDAGGEPLCAERRLYVDDAPPLIRVDTPAPFSYLEGGDGLIEVTGQVEENGGDALAWVNGEPLELDEFGAFTAQVPVHIGSNRITITADDGLRQPATQLGFDVFWAPAWRPVEAGRFVVPQGIQLQVDQSLFDSDTPLPFVVDRAITLQELAHFFEYLLSTLDPSTLLADLPGLGGSGLTIENASLGPVEIDFTLTEEGLELFIALRALSISLDGSLDLFGESISLNGTLNASILAISTLRLSASPESALEVEVDAVSVVVESLEGDFEDPSAEVLIESVGGALRESLSESVESLLSGLVAEQLPAILAEGVASAFDAIAELPLSLISPVEGGQPVSLSLQLIPQRLMIDPARMLTLIIDVAIQHLGAAPRAPYQDPGVASLTEGPPPQRAPLEAARLIGRASLDFVNGIFHEVWRSRLLEIRPPLPEELSILLSALEISGHFPPLLRTDRAGNLELSLGGVEVVLNGLAGEIDRYTVSLATPLRLEVDGAQFSFLLDEEPTVEAALIQSDSPRPLLSEESLASLFSNLVWPQVRAALDESLSLGIDPVQLDTLSFEALGLELGSVIVAPRFSLPLELERGWVSLGGLIEISVSPRE
ncbi:MAG: hypothetical protein VYD19_09965 [Myxococcota bacterium]|nr:hypothetical protein [Myxococcota bacterium]